MRNSPIDQAAGLRRIMSRTTLRVLPVVSGMRGVGHTSTTINLVAALADSGHRIVVLDAGRALIAAALNLKARYELLHLLTGEKSIAETMLSADTFDVLPATKGVEEFMLSAGAIDELFSVVTNSDQLYDLAIMAVPGAVAAALTSPDTEIAMVTSDDVHAIKSTYAAMKKLATEYGRKRFRIIFNDVENSRMAQDAYARLADTSQKFLHVELALGGIVPCDPAIRRATAANTHVFNLERSRARLVFTSIAADVESWHLAEFTATAQFA